MIKLLTCMAAIWAFSGLSDARADDATFGDWTVKVSESTSEAPAADLGDWVVAITPGETKQQAAASPKAKPRTMRVNVSVASPRCQHPASWYAYHLPRVRSGASIYFPWKNYRRLVGFTSQYRPRTIYNYGR